MSITTELLVLVFGLTLLGILGSPAGRVPSKSKCLPGSKVEDCLAKCAPNDHQCNINSQFPEIDVVEVVTSKPNSPSVVASSTTIRPPSIITSTTKKPESTQPGGGISDSLCPQYPILQPSGSESKNPNCRFPISQYGCKQNSQDPWCRFFTFMYQFGNKSSE